jgi:hypothetical protein
MSIAVNTRLPAIVIENKTKFCTDHQLNQKPLAQDELEKVNPSVSTALDFETLMRECTHFAFALTAAMGNRAGSESTRENAKIFKSKTTE